jgi:hypothetical protein
MTLDETSIKQQTNPLAGEIGDFSGSILHGTPRRSLMIGNLSLVRTDLSMHRTRKNQKKPTKTEDKLWKFSRAYQRV